LSDIARQLGLTARAGISGVGSLPLMVGDVMNAGLNLIPGVNLPSASQSAQTLMTAAGLPAPQNAIERINQDVASAMTGVGATAKLAQAASPLMSARARPSLDLFTQRLGMQTGSAAGAAGAAGAVREEGGGAGAQLAAGLTGGLLGPLVPQSVTAVTRGLREMISPMTRQGVESTAGNVLSQLSRDRTTALANLESYTPTVPGVTPTTAAAAKDYGLAGEILWIAATISFSDISSGNSTSPTPGT